MAERAVRCRLNSKHDSIACSANTVNEDSKQEGQTRLRCMWIEAGLSHVYEVPHRGYETCALESVINFVPLFTLS